MPFFLQPRTRGVGGGNGVGGSGEPGGAGLGTQRGTKLCPFFWVGRGGTDHPGGSKGPPQEGALRNETMPFFLQPVGGG